MSFGLILGYIESFIALNRFADLIDKLTGQNAEKAKVDALVQYFELCQDTSEVNDAWNLLMGNSMKRVVSTRQLKEWASTLTGLPPWLIERSEKEVGNFLKSFNLLIGAKKSVLKYSPLSKWLAEIHALHDSSSQEIQHFIRNELTTAEHSERLILLRILTGNFRSPVSVHEIAICLAKLLKLKTEIISLRLHMLGKRSNHHFDDLKKPVVEENQKLPSAFPVIESITQKSAVYTQESGWNAFGKQAGLEAQLVKHGDELHIWTRKGDIITDKFPEITTQIPAAIQNFKAFGQIVAKNYNIPISELYSRLSKKNSRNMLKKGFELAFEVWELILGHIDVSLRQSTFVFPKQLHFSTIDDLNELHKQCRNHGISGIILKHQNNLSFKYWKATPLAVCAVLMNVEFSNVNSSGLQSLTYGVFNNDEIVPVVKISSIDNQIDCNSIIEFAKNNTLERFGPVRSVKLQLVYHINFDSIAISTRRKSGVKLINARLTKHISNDPTQADSLSSLKNLLS